MYRMDDSQNPGKLETDTSKIQKIAMKGNNSKKLATSNVAIGDSNLLETGGTRVNQIKASASNQLLTNQPSNVTSSDSATMDETEQVISIDVLCDDCLLIIFRHLSIVDRVSIERVSRRWNVLSKSSWSHVKHLVSNSQSWGFRPRGFLSDEVKKINVEELEEVLKRCGKFLESIDVAKIYIPCHDSELGSIVIASYVASTIVILCPGIKVLRTKLLGANTLKKIVTNCKDIIELCITCVNHILEIELSDFLSNYKNLRILKLPSLTDASFLLNLSLLETLEVKHLIDPSKTRYLVNALINMQNLKVIQLNLYYTEANDVIVALQNCSNLEKLDLGICGLNFDNENQLGLLLKNNQKLETLSLGFFNLTGECLIYLNPECFKELRFHCCDNLNFVFFNKYLKNFNQFCNFEYAHDEINLDNYKELIKFISSLGNLEYLNLLIKNEEFSLSDNFNLLSKLANLEELILEGYLLNEYDCLKIIGKYFKNLKTLVLQPDDDVSDDTELNEITNLPKLEKLTLYGIHEITGLGFNKMKNLKKLHIFWCNNIGIDCLKKILRESEKLECLSVRDCDKINTIDLLLFANEITKKRTNNIILYIHDDFFKYLNYENVESIKNIKKSPFLEYTDIPTEEEF